MLVRKPFRSCICVYFLHFYYVYTFLQTAKQLLKCFLNLHVVHILGCLYHFQGDLVIFYSVEICLLKQFVKQHSTPYLVFVVLIILNRFHHGSISFSQHFETRINESCLNISSCYELFMQTTIYENAVRI